jgi:hypothetical protein
MGFYEFASEHPMLVIALAFLVALTIENVARMMSRSQ